MLRVVITGAESTGKSTLTKELADYFKAPFTEEFVRSYVNRVQRSLEASDLNAIFQGQYSIEQAGCTNKPPLVFHDTNLLSNLIYADYYFKQIPDRLKLEILNQNYGLYLLCDTDIPWEADGLQRESSDLRSKLQKVFIEELAKRKIKPVLISGTKKERLEIAIQAVQKMLSSKNS